MVSGSAETTGESGLRKEYIDGAVKAVALANYKLKPLCSIESSSAWTESYYRETNTELTGGGVASPTNVKGIPRLAPFPYAQVIETKISALIDKYGMEGMISFEDKTFNNVNMIARTLVRIGRSVSYAVDAQILAVISASFGNTVAVGVGSEWNSATVANRDPILNILQGMQTLRVDNIDPLNGKGHLVVNGDSYTDIISNSKVVSNPTFKSYSVVDNGVVGEICGLKIVTTEVVAADTAYIVMAQEALVWKEAIALTVLQIEDPGIKTTIRAYELGVCQLVAPNGVCKFTNTRA